MITYSVFFSFLFALFLLYLKFKNRVPILMYHRIADVPGDRNALPPEKFREQMQYLSRSGYSAITMSMLYDYYQHGKPLPPKPILLTFDDAYQDNFSTALPILCSYNMRGVVFPIANWIGRENKWENFNKALTRTMDWTELAAWRNSGMEIASHTVNHPFLTNCSPLELNEELQQSKRRLESKLGEPIDFICYPYGCFNEETIAAVKQCAYKGAFAIFDSVPLWNISLFALPRIQIPAHQSLWEFKLKTSSIHMIFIAMRKWERTIKRFLKNKQA